MPADFRNSRTNRLRPAQQISSCRSSEPQNAQASSVHRPRRRKSSISSTAVGQFNPPSSSSRAITPIDQRRADRTFAHRKKFMRAEPKVAQRRKLAQCAPAAASGCDNSTEEKHAGESRISARSSQSAAKSRAKLRFEFQLSLVRNVLVMASAALPEVRTASLDRSGEASINCVTDSARKPRLLLPDLGLNPSPRQHERHKHSHAAPVRASRSAGQAVAAVDQFFNGKQQAFVKCSAGTPAREQRSRSRSAMLSR
jgi:hypothetical protein